MSIWVVGVVGVVVIALALYTWYLVRRVRKALQGTQEFFHVGGHYLVSVRAGPGAGRRYVIVHEISQDGQAILCSSSESLTREACSRMNPTWSASMDFAILGVLSEPVAEIADGRGSYR